MPMPPSVNKRLVPGRSSWVLSEAFRLYKEEAPKIAKAGIEGKLLEPIKGNVQLKLDFYFVRKNGDLTNRFKAIEDALIGVVYVDDIQVTDFSAKRHIVPKDQKPREPYVLVTVQEIDE